MKISRKKLLELIEEATADQMGGPGATQYTDEEGNVAAAPSADDQFAADMASRAASDVEAYASRRRSAMDMMGEFDGGTGDPYTYNFDKAAMRLTQRNEKLYATAATKDDPSHPDADPITGHVVIGKSFRVPETSSLYTQIMDVHGDEVDAMLGKDRVAQVDDGSSSSSSSDSSSDSLTDLFESSNIQLMITQEIVSQLVAEVNLNKMLKKGKQAKSVADLDKLIDKAKKAKREELRDAALAGLATIKKDMLTKLGDEQDRTADPEAVTKVMQKIDSDRQAQVEPDHKHGKFTGGRGDPYTYDYVRWKGQELMAMARTRTDKETGEIEQIDKMFAVSPEKSPSLYTQMMADEDIKNAKPESDTVSQVVVATPPASPSSDS